MICAQQLPSMPQNFSHLPPSLEGGEAPEQIGQTFLAVNSLQACLKTSATFLPR